MEPINVNVTSGVERNWQFVAKEIGNFNFIITAGSASLTVPMTIKLGEQIDYEQAGLL